MGMSHKAPTSSYRRTYMVTDHACERFRTRILVEDGCPHRSDADICNIIDSLVCGSIDGGTYEDIYDEGVKAQLVDIRGPKTGNDMWAVVKKNTNSRTNGKYPFAIVTLLYTDMVDNSKKAGKWKEPPTEVVSTRRVLTPAPEEPMESKVHGLILVRHTQRGTTGALYSEWLDTESAEKHINKLRRDPNVDNDSIRVFGEITTEVKIII